MPPTENRDFAVAIVKGLKEVTDAVASIKDRKPDMPNEVFDVLNAVKDSIANMKGDKGDFGDKGDKGDVGVSITGAHLSDKELVLTLSNGTEVNAGVVVGENGQDAVFDEEAITKKILALVPKSVELDTKALKEEILSEVPKGVSLTEVKKTIKESKVLYKDLKDAPDLLEEIKKQLAIYESTRPTTAPGASALSMLLDTDFSGLAVGQSIRWTGRVWIPYTPAGGGATNVFGESLTAQGAGVTFTLAHTPIAGTVRLYRGGAYQSVTDGDYTIAGAIITLTVAKVATEGLTADYNW